MVRHRNAACQLRWVEVRKSNPCPVCRHMNWCAVSDDGKWGACRRNLSGVVKTDKNGSPYSVVRLDGEPLEQFVDSGPTEPERDRAGDEVLDLVYRDLLRRLPLSRKHHDALVQRGLKGQTVRDNGYATLPSIGRPDLIGDVALRYPEINPHTVPGLYRNNLGRWTLAGVSGLVIPVRDVQGRIVGCQIRADKPGEGGKYRWLSSRRNGGSSPGVRAHCPLLARPPAKTVRLTEGPLKADVANLLSGVPTIAFPGVMSWRTCLPLLTQLEAAEVLLAFDQDWRTNKVVAGALAAAYRALKKNYRVGIEVW